MGRFVGWLSQSRWALGAVAGLVGAGLAGSSEVHAQACPDPNVEGVLYDDTVREGDACVYFVRVPDNYYSTRSFRVLVPDKYLSQVDAKDRLVLDYHGFGSSKSSQMKTSCWKTKAQGVGAIVAYPNGTGFPTSFSAGDYCCNLMVGLQRDDVQFARDVAEKAKEVVHALTGAGPVYAPKSENDTWRVYVSGLSNGGAVSHNLACEATDLIDGMASVSQTYAKRPGTSCLEPGETPVPVLDFRALDDIVIPYNGGLSAATLWATRWLSAEQSRLAWASTLGCGPDVITRSDYDKPRTECTRMLGCSTDFVQCTIDGPHVAYTAAKNSGVDVCDAAWEFFGEEETPEELDLVLLP